MQFAYPGTAVDVAEIDPAVTRANFMATGLPRDTTIKTYWGDARQFVELHQDTKQYDLVFGDAFNDFSVPWHLTTREFNEKIKKMLTPNGVYMINIIDVYETDAEAEEKAEEEIEKIDEEDRTTREGANPAQANGPGPPLRRLRRRLDQDRQAHFRPRLYLRHRRSPGHGPRDVRRRRVDEASSTWKTWGTARTIPKFFTPRGRKPSRSPIRAEDEKTVINDRSRNIILTDDYAPVENLLAPVAETRGDDDD